MEWSPLDLVIFFGSLIGVMAMGLIAGRKEDTAEDYFLAGKTIRWWGVAGSIFGSNVSANHMVGMMGAGFAFGFAQAHFEYGAIVGLMVLCYFFLPVYRKLNVYTLSEYLEKRYDHRSRLLYALIMLILMVLVQMVPALYIGSRSACVLMGDKAITTTIEEKAVEDSDTGETDVVVTQVVNWNYYALFVILIAMITTSYTIFGGLKAVVWTDAIQSVMILIAGITLAYLTFNQLGGWDLMVQLDSAGDAVQNIEAGNRLHLYRPSNADELPWTGVFTGLMCMHCYYWGTNQFIVQRALGAKSDGEARSGIVAAGFLKLTIPIFSIGTGIAAFYLFQAKIPEELVAQDVVFTKLLGLVVPAGVGLIGLISAGLIGAILSSIDSMMNSAATIVTIDIYKRYFKPEASDKELILIGRLAIAVFVMIATLMALFVTDPNSKENFFLQIVNYQGALVPGILVAFFFGMFWKRGNSNAAFWAILSGIGFSFLFDFGAKAIMSSIIENNSPLAPKMLDMIGAELNFFHRVVLVLICSSIVYIVITLFSKPDESQEPPTWQAIRGVSKESFKRLLVAIFLSLVVFLLLALGMVGKLFTPTNAGLLAAIWVGMIRLPWTAQSLRERKAAPENKSVSAMKLILTEDRIWSTGLCMCTIFLMYYFY